MNCPECESENTTVDYGCLDDPTRTPEAVAKGETPYCCLDCGAGWRSP